MLIPCPLANFSVSQALVTDARDILCAILRSPGPDFPRALYILRFSAKHQELRRRFIALYEVIETLIFALDGIPKSPSKDLFPLVVDSLCYLIDDGTYDWRPPMYMLILYLQMTNEPTLSISLPLG